MQTPQIPSWRLMSTMQALMTERYSRLYFKILHSTGYPHNKPHLIHCAKPTQTYLKCHKPHNSTLMSQMLYSTYRLFLAIAVWLPSICCWIFEKIPAHNSNWAGLHSNQTNWCLRRFWHKRLKHRI